MAAAASGKSMNAWCTNFLALAAKYTLQRGLLTSSYGEEVRQVLERESAELAEELLRALGGGAFPARVTDGADTSRESAV